MSGGTRGEANGNSKLSEGDVVAIYQMGRKRVKTQKQLADEFGVCEAMVIAIVNDRAWQWLTCALDIEKQKPRPPKTIKSSKAICDVCGSEFDKVRTAKRCSPECMRKYQKQRLKERYEDTKRPVISNCVICGERFQKLGQAVTCSKECRAERRRQSDRARRAVIVNCDVCGKQFRKTAGKSKRCSDECRKAGKQATTLKNSRTEHARKYRSEYKKRNRPRINELQQATREKHPERSREYTQKYYWSQPEKFRRRARESSKRCVETLSDGYVRQLLGLSSVSFELLELKRQHVKLKRVLKEKHSKTEEQK